MQQRLTRYLTRARDTFGGFTAGQKAVAVIGTAALLIAVFMVFRWVSTPSYAPLYSNLSGTDASAVIEELDSQGVPYKIAGGGGTIMVPRSDVYSTRITLSGKGLPASTDGGYSLLDKQSLSTSESQEQTNFKRAMEGELSKTVEAIHGVDTAVVHLAIPEKQVFTDEQDPPTASVLIDTEPGTSLDDGQVQAIVHLVASSIDGLEPKNVTLTDASGKLLTTDDSADGGVSAASARTKQVEAFQDSMQTDIQAVLDRVLGPGNSTVTVTADLDFDKAVTDSRTYGAKENIPPLSESSTNETYAGPASGANAPAGGVVGPDGQMDPTTTGTGDSSYKNSSKTRDNALDQTVEHREKAPGSINTLHIGAVLDATAAAAVQPQVVKDLISNAVGINAQRGDTIDVTTMAFDRSAEKSAAAELKAAKAADATARRNSLLRNIGIAGGILLMILLAWLQARRRAKVRDDARAYLVEQLRTDAASRTAQLEAPALAALESSEKDEEESMRDELIALVDRQPDDVAALLRGWLVEPRP
ncbi:MULTISPECIES: flagellar basal-body MS-ring/collar protein FliF [unclassified Nocardioides]|uniref:flagellar basal-body MS-ring/collar protein FliF n=1 Tax=unclassified Nocardioides TaxID=2615069 RepID=UPI00114F4963|nr:MULTISPECIES: flagellar basal-body MS-ring/collar protein FliF [unclassified Nocardioides]TQK69566.1 flagellar M-ring protein FliF [Nocardioides sp. SLBN-35]WGY01190.1 flagellar basal-body MS-ring/collar protein FliF [Nocardioides sp. QY071]